MKTAGDMGHCLETWGVSALSPLHQGGMCQGLSPLLPFKSDEKECEYLHSQ